ncbi:MAG: HAMP domain-containing histidine kinase [Rhodobacteraceae bacterium]|nr:HAMP domain-containing histidine kinase [Paracoccaceae bacterium]
MRLRSLAARLILLSCLSIAVALGTIGFVLGERFNTYFEDRVYSELGAHLDQLTANLSFDAEGDMVVKSLPDPRFEAPFSGHYWQVQRPDHPQMVSRSLLTGSINVPAFFEVGMSVRSALESPQGQPLLALSRAVIVGLEEAESRVELTVAINQSEVQRAAAGFRTTMLGWMFLIFLGLIGAAWVQVKLGLAPLETLRLKVERVRSGQDDRLKGNFPTEVQPLAREVNELLELHEMTVEQARERASNLAHGLKTPLTVINTVARDLRKNGQSAEAEEIATQIASMSHFIERELARVRIRPAGRFDHPAREVAQKMLKTIQRFPRETPLDWQFDIPQGFTSPFDSHDLSELLGNLLDNARKWAGTQVRLSAGESADGCRYLRVEDDGEGVDEEGCTRLGQRGQRLDPSAQGSGLGLAICTDLAAHYGATIEISRSSMGGLMVTVSWPATA